MPYQIAPVFAVPLVQDYLPDALVINQQLRALLLSREAEGDRYANPNPSLQQQPGVFESDLNLFSWPERCIQILKEFAWATLGRTIKELNGYEAEELKRLQIFSHTWFHVTRHGGFTILHTHPMASWSGVYCVDSGKSSDDYPESGVLRFHNPHHYSNYFQDPGNSKLRAPYHHGTWSVKLQPGQLVLFPSWLQHEVMPFYGDNERITIAFNCWLGMRSDKQPL